MLGIAIIVWEIAFNVCGIAACIHLSKQDRPKDDTTARLALLVRLL